MMIYLASPYSHEDKAVMEQRFNDVCKLAARYMGNGMHIFSPIAHTHPIAVAGELPRGWDFWEKYDRAVISKCDELHVLMMDGWAESKGVKAEIAIARELGKPVRYVDPYSDEINGEISA